MPQGEVAIEFEKVGCVPYAAGGPLHGVTVGSSRSQAVRRLEQRCAELAPPFWGAGVVSPENLEQIDELLTVVVV